MSAVNFIISLARKILARESKGITKIPTQMAAEAKAGEIAARLQDAGLPLNRADEFIKSEQDLVRILNMIESTPPVMREVPSGIRNTEKGKVFDMQGKEIPKGSKIMGGKQLTDSPLGDLKSIVDDFKPIKDQPPPGSRGGKDDIAAPFASQEETMSNMIKDELMKTDNAFSDLVKTTKKGPKTLYQIFFLLNPLQPFVHYIFYLLLQMLVTYYRLRL